MYEAPAPVKVEGGGRAGQRRWLSHWGTRALGGSASPAGAQNEGSLPKCPTRVQDGQTFTPLSLSVTGCQLSPKEVAPGRWVSAAQAHPEGDGALQLTTFLQPVSRKRMWAVPPCPPQAFHLRDPALPSPRARGDPAETAGPVVKDSQDGTLASPRSHGSGATTGLPGCRARVHNQHHTTTSQAEKWDFKGETAGTSPPLC